jgi:hypothetical protein
MGEGRFAVGIYLLGPTHVAIMYPGRLPRHAQCPLHRHVCYLGGTELDENNLQGRCRPILVLTRPPRDNRRASRFTCATEQTQRPPCILDWARKLLNREQRFSAEIVPHIGTNSCMFHAERFQSTVAHRPILYSITSTVYGYKRPMDQIPSPPQNPLRFVRLMFFTIGNW